MENRDGSLRRAKSSGFSIASDTSKIVAAARTNPHRLE
jgi:hypothetical protein